MLTRGAVNPAEKQRIDDILQRCKEEVVGIHDEECENGLEAKRLEKVHAEFKEVMVRFLLPPPSSLWVWHYSSVPCSVVRCTHKVFFCLTLKIQLMPSQVLRAAFPFNIPARISSFKFEIYQSPNKT